MSLRHCPGSAVRLLRLFPTRSSLPAPCSMCIPIEKGISMRRLLVVILVIMLPAVFLCMSGGQQQAFAAGTGPCDIYASGGTPCVAAHSTVRALFGAYSGRLYQVTRASDSAKTDIG